MTQGSTEALVSLRALRNHLRLWGELVKFSHSVFALPFALSMVVVASRMVNVTGVALAWILICVVSARTAAMAYNRLLDHTIDAKNPRTLQRELPRGALSRSSVWALCVVSIGVFVFGAAQLGTHCLVLTPVVLAVLLGYSWTKRFTESSHFVLGVALALAPGGVWYALVGTIELFPVWMMLAVAFWVAGFDILYSCQDQAFDRAIGLFSVPARIGIGRALQLARVAHCAAVLFLALFGYVGAFGIWYWLGLGLFATLLASQHRLVSASDLSRINAAFFTRNGLASIGFFVFVLLDRVLGAVH